MGEAAKNVPGDVRADAPHLPWRAMCGMRDVLSHGYGGVSRKQLWTTATIDLPTILPDLKALAARHGGDPDATDWRSSD